MSSSHLLELRTFYFFMWLFICNILYKKLGIVQTCLTMQHHELQHARLPTLSFTISRCLLKLMSIESVMPSNHLVLCHPLFLLPSVFPRVRVFSMSQLFASGGQSIRALALASVLPMNIQDWVPLGLTGLISLQSKGLSRVFSNTRVQKHQFFSAQPS